MSKIILEIIMKEVEPSNSTLDEKKIQTFGQLMKVI